MRDPRMWLRRKAEFDAAFASGRRRTAGGLVLLMRPNGLDGPRLGMVITRKAGNAVARNRIRRLIREAYRQTRGRIGRGVDLVAMPAPSFGRPKMREVATWLLAASRDE